MNATPAFPLRALGIGEIFDRAVTIYVRNFVVFTLMVLTLLAPYSIAQYFTIPDQSATFTKMIDQISHPTKKTAAAPAAVPGPASLMLFLAVVFVFALLSPFIACAVAYGVAAIYNGKTPEYAASFAAVGRRWPSIAGTAILGGLIFLTAYVVTVFLVALFFIVAALSIKFSVPVAVVLFILAALVLLVAIGLFIVLAMNYVFGTYAATLEGLDVGAAVSSGFRRIFSRQELGKAFLMGLSYLALQFGVAAISGAIGIVVLYVLKSYALELAVTAIAQSILTAFLAIVVAVYYYDVRTRAEGLDLEMDLRRLTA